MFFYKEIKKNLRGPRLNKFLYSHTSYLINANIKTRIAEKFNNLIYTDPVNFVRAMSTTEHCIPQRSSKQSSILDSTKYFAACVDLATAVDLAQELFLIPHSNTNIDT